jgi:SecD/SecF fusion protein
MFKRHLWKIVFSVAIAVWGITELLPLQDAPSFAQWAKEHATDKPADFAKLVDEAAARKKAGTAASEFVALKQIGKERKVDLTVYFPNVNIEKTLRNVEKRNELLLNELLLRSKGRLQLGLDLKGGVAVTLEASDRPGAPAVDEQQRKEKITKAIDIIGQRINQYGVAEPIIRSVGTNRIEIQLPGVNTKDNPEIVDVLKKPAQLSFRLVHPTSRPGPGVDVPAGYEAMTERDEDGRLGGVQREYFVKMIPEMTGEMIDHASAIHDPTTGRPKVTMEFTKVGRTRFAEVTRTIAAMGQGSNPGLLAIVLDGQLYSAPTVQREIDSPSAEISGTFTDREVINLANVLNNPLDVELQIKEQYEVGPSLAQDAIDSGKMASIIGVGLVAAFMVTFYSTGGLIAVVTLAVNLLIILGTMASFHSTMTLPGLAGIVLTVGMAVDANILIFERMREEIAAGKTLAASNQSGFFKALWTILDAHIVQLLICTIMILLGTGPIKGFGVTLAIGVLSTLFSVLVTAHLLMEILIESNWLKKITMRRMLGDLQVDFIKFGKPAAIGSILLVVVSFGYVVYQGSHIFGIDFAGGDVISLQFKQKLDTAKVRDTAKAAGVNEVTPTYVSPIGGGRETLNVEAPEGKGEVILTALQKAYPEAGFEKVGLNHIGAAIGNEILWNALKAVGISMLVILIYIAFRFEFGFGVGAMASTFHDVLMNIGIFVLFGHQFSAPMVAAILCVIGYSINETVIVFDRIREELKLNPTGTLRDVINTAIRKVFARTIMTATTTFLAALALFIFGHGVLRDISFTFLVGIVTSTFSAIFIAAQVFYWWHKGDRKHVEAHQDVAPTYEWQGSSKASE